MPASSTTTPITTTQWPADDGVGKDYCDWLEATNTEVKFRMCTFDTTVDTQISFCIHKDGHWNGWKKELIEQMLPRMRDGLDSPFGGDNSNNNNNDGSSSSSSGASLTGRTLVIDVGSNIGFFTVLAATRGYDVLSIEASKDAVIRQLYSLYGNGIRVAKHPSEIASRAGALRKPIVYVMQNAASDAYGNGNLEYVKDNPGASWITTNGVVTGKNSQPVTTVYLDDLLISSSSNKGNGNSNNNKNNKDGSATGTGSSSNSKVGPTASSGTMKRFLE
jgi:FkbM family methyltransferase